LWRCSNVAGQDIGAKGDAQAGFQAAGIERVTVPAGTFEALDIHVDTTIEIHGGFNGVSFPVRVTTPYDYWFVKDVGGESFSETIELQSYSVA